MICTGFLGKHALVVLALLWMGGAAFAATPLERAAASGDLARVKVLLGEGAEIDNVDPDSTWEKTPLFAAAEAGREKVVRYLLARGAKIDKTNAAGATPLRKAVINGHLAVVEALLEAGADPESDTDSYGRSPLVWAILSARGNRAAEYVAIARALRGAGARCPQTFTHPVNDSVQDLAAVAKTMSPQMAAAFPQICPAP